MVEMKNTKLSRKRMADNYETALAGVNADIASRMAVGRWTSRAVTIESAYPEVLIKAEAVAERFCPDRVRKGADFIVVEF